MLTREEGALAVRTARKVIEEYVRNGRVHEVELPESFNEKSGVFVTLKKEHDLRGCIGYPYPSTELKEALVDAAIQAATQDPRFPKVKKDELERINVEVTVLTPPKQLKVKPLERPKHVVIGRDGLIVEHGRYRGLLLPQVPLEWDWNVTEYLENACMKAGLFPDAWVDEKTKIYTFTGQIFEEREPNGEVVEKRIDEALDKCE